MEVFWPNKKIQAFTKVPSNLLKPFKMSSIEFRSWSKKWKKSMVINKSSKRSMKTYFIKWWKAKKKKKNLRTHWTKYCPSLRHIDLPLSSKSHQLIWRQTFPTSWIRFKVPWTKLVQLILSKTLPPIQKIVLQQF